MRNNPFKSTRSHPLFSIGVVLAASLFWMNAGAQVLLYATQDGAGGDILFLSYPTGPAVNDSSTTTDLGISLVNFFNTPVSTVSIAENPEVSPFRPNSGSITYDVASTDASTPLTRNLRFYSDVIPSQTQTFSTSSRAFQGWVSLRMAAFAGNLPAVGSTGLITSGWTGSPGVVLGTWIYLPEPSTYGIATGGCLIAFGIWRKKKTSFRNGAK